MKRLKVRNALACEYVAQGHNRKHSLINTYGDKVLVQSFPALIPLSFYIEIEVVEGMKGNVEFEIYENKKSKAKIEAGFEPVVGSLLTINIPQLPYNLDNPTNIKVVARCDGFADTALITQRVEVGPV